LVKLKDKFRGYFHRAAGADEQTVHYLRLRDYLLDGGLSLGRRLPLGSVSVDTRANQVCVELEDEDGPGGAPASSGGDYEDMQVPLSSGVEVLVLASQ
jgi:hypothetical protein